MKKIIVLFFGLLFSSSLFAASFDQIVFFGDSLTDSGNLYQLYHKLIPQSPPYYQGRFVNGQTWAENVDRYYYDKTYTAGENYALGGATVLPPDPAMGRINSTTTLEAELTAYYQDAVLEDKNRTLYFLWMGANDYLYDTASDMEKLTSAVVDKISWAIDSLAANGANKIFVMNLPDLAKTPYGKTSGTGEKLHQFVEMHNTKLNDAMQKLKIKYPNIQLVTVDVYGMLEDLVSNPDKYHFKNTTEACLAEVSHSKNTHQEKAQLISQLKKSFGLLESETIADTILKNPALAVALRVGKGYGSGDITICTDAREHLFWDAIHPSALTHEILAGIIEKQVDGLGKS